MEIKQNNATIWKINLVLSFATKKDLILISSQTVTEYEINRKHLMIQHERKHINLVHMIWNVENIVNEKQESICRLHNVQMMLSIEKYYHQGCGLFTLLMRQIQCSLLVFYTNSKWECVCIYVCVAACVCIVLVSERMTEIALPTVRADVTLGFNQGLPFFKYTRCRFAAGLHCLPPVGET